MNKKGSVQPGDLALCHIRVEGIRKAVEQVEKSIRDTDKDLQDKKIDSLEAKVEVITHCAVGIFGMVNLPRITVGSI